MLGKRKRETAVISRKAEKDESTPSAPSAPPATIDAQDLLRKHFESRFEPLESAAPAKRFESDASSALSSGDENESDWDGISDNSEDAGPEVVEHGDLSRHAADPADKVARKNFMTTKPPSSTQSLNKPEPKRRGNGDGDEDEEGTDAANLKKDLALQRLLKESHLLDSASDLNPTGKNRHRALDIRMQSVGSSSSMYEQKKMPMSHRKGIETRVAYKEDKRRQEAKENGIILEKPGPKHKTAGGGGGGAGRRERGVGGPSVGKFAGGTLRLSKKDVMDIQGPKHAGKGKGKGKRGRR